MYLPELGILLDLSLLPWLRNLCMPMCVCNNFGPIMYTCIYTIYNYECNVCIKYVENICEIYNLLHSLHEHFILLYL